MLFKKIYRHLKYRHQYLNRDIYIEISECRYLQVNGFNSKWIVLRDRGKGHVGTNGT